MGGKNYFPKATKYLEVFAVYVYMVVEVKLHIILSYHLSQVI